MTSSAPIDLRSDTVTRPDDRMRAAMAAAEVGDDVLDHDPTMRALEERVAGLLGTAAALWVPSGTMGNLIALMLHLKRGDRFLAPRGAHVLNHELGSAAWLAGGMPDPLDWDAGPGRPTAEAVRAQARITGAYDALHTTLLCLENTHNGAGGAVVPPHEHAQLAAAAKELGLRVHLDGARLWNAAAALGVPTKALTVGVEPETRPQPDFDAAAEHGRPPPCAYLEGLRAFTDRLLGRDGRAGEAQAGAAERPKPPLAKTGTASDREKSALARRGELIAASHSGNREFAQVAVPPLNAEEVVEP